MAVQPIEQRVKRILSKGEIASVTLILSGHGVSAMANPTSFHPLVKARREEAFAAAGMSLSMSEATAITTNSMGVVGRGFASDISGAIKSLEDDLKRVSG